RIDALLLGSLQSSQGCTLPAALLSKGFNSRIRRCCIASERVIGGDRQEGCAEQRVGACGIDSDLRVASGGAVGNEFPADRHTLGPADPVLLHQPDLLWPLVQRVTCV